MSDALELAARLRAEKGRHPALSALLEEAAEVLGQQDSELDGMWYDMKEDRD